ncbi:MAG: cephalosporin hydroxylase family protein [Armatimonadetes bacterium]|nr:cephalosporin hydroxylase family protein [Armatimonadota bacterium]
MTLDNRTAVLDSFHRLYYESNAFTRTSWLGVTALKCPLDLWIYQEIIHALRPDLIVECGTASGGSALFLAGICDLVGNGRVITIDIEDKPGRPEHPRIAYLNGSSTSPDIVEQVGRAAAEDDRVLVLLDSDHSKDHVLAELRAYSGFVTAGSYLIVEDTNIGGHPVRPEAGPGPMEAVDEFLAENSAFAIDESKEKFFLTFNPRGYLRRTR